EAVGYLVNAGIATLQDHDTCIPEGFDAAMADAERDFPETSTLYTFVIMALLSSDPEQLFAQTHHRWRLSASFLEALRVLDVNVAPLLANERLRT
ncbi:MAG: hypothetical protein R6V07_05495, partial [Armatimonadota bacterium]